jgi:serine/threonine-protein kinase RsbW
MTTIDNEIEVIISSTLENLDLIQILTDCVTNFMSFDEDDVHRIGMSVRESVTNAIQHGNKLDVNKKVDICFRVAADALIVSVKDQGNGFRVEDLPNPLDVENLLRPSGRGIFYMRTFMDTVEFRPAYGGGTEVYMVKKISSNSKENAYEDHDTHRG